MKLGLHLIEYPSKKFGFVGNVPWNLAYLADNAEQVESELLLPATYRKIKTRTFMSAAGALAVAKDLGYSLECSESCACRGAK